LGLNLRNDSTLSELANRYSQRVKLFECDLTNNIEIEEIYGKLKLDFGVFNAGKDSVPSSSSGEVPDLLDFSLSSWSDYASDNLKVFVNSLNFFCEHRKSTAYGVVIGSMYTSVIPRDSNYFNDHKQVFRKHPGYGAAKSGIKSVMKQYAARYASEGLVLNMLSPGIVENAQPDWFRKNVLVHVPNGKLLDKDSLAAALDFLTSPASEHLVGQELIFDGGYNLW
jgi:NAD(P)-dependent dehydrogenase (short-subunit alcohol dehydrogenase family)